MKFSSLFPRVPDHLLAPSIFKLGKEAISKKYLRIWSFFHSCIILEGWYNRQTVTLDSSVSFFGFPLYVKSMRLCASHCFVAIVYSWVIFINFYPFY